MKTLTILSAVLLVLGCSTTATIYMKDGSVVEGEIRRTDATDILVFPKEAREGKGDYPTGILEQEILDECIKTRINKCRKKCKRQHTIIEDLRRCAKSCPDRETAKNVCEPTSVVIPVPRAEIDDISHPGKTAAIIGTLLMVVGGTAGLIATLHGPRLCGEYGCTFAELAIIYGGLLLDIGAVVGLFVAGWGYSKWFASSGAANWECYPDRPKLSPVAITDGQRTYLGLGFSYVW